MTTVEIQVGTETDAGQRATLVALDGDFNLLDFDTIILSSNLQTLSTVAAGTAISILTGPCVMVADDLVFD